MVAKFARFPLVARIAGRRFGSVAVPCNDNDPSSRRAAPARPLRRPVLVRRWSIAPDGALECHWSIAAGGDEDGPAKPRRIGVPRVPGGRRRRGHSCAM
jgi:hypothetical protein